MKYFSAKNTTDRFLPAYLYSRPQDVGKKECRIVMHRARISEPTDRANKSTTVMQRQEGNFISSALGLKPHPTRQNLTRAPNKGVWRLIYRQFFVSVTGVAGVT